VRRGARANDGSLHRDELMPRAGRVGTETFGEHLDSTIELLASKISVRHEQRISSKEPRSPQSSVDARSDDFVGPGHPAVFRAH